MADYQSILAYDGTEFAGFQRQRGRRTVQGEVEQALGRLGWKERSLRAAGRTDTGVHATGQVFAFRLSWSRSVDGLTGALNAHLPSDASVLQTQEAPAGFHPRYAARWRRYRYRLVASAVRQPLRERYAWRVWPTPDFRAMQLAARALIGEHDFGGFGTAPRADGHTVRMVYRADWEQAGDETAFVIEANAFLYRMVRRLVGALVAVGQGTETPTSFAARIDDRADGWQGKLAPARGLCLEAVGFEDR
ncbi:MAG TPA: tRNA pseudouridine(38-40) synthase TruA [Anaerolineales bacterium]|nr:tRNA pseudouridine(38-40) synthase TruA [Anaerolineales bacterium]